MNEIIPDYLYELAAQTVADLKAWGLTLAAAESCTGGLLAACIVSVPGASEVFSEGIVSYSDESKVARLGVSRRTLKEHGAVSSRTAGEMAKGVTAALGADIGVSVTGIAGPGGGTPEKPVGLVYIGVYYKDVIVYKYNFSGTRTEIRAQSVETALRNIINL